MRAVYRIFASHSNPEKVALDAGYLIGVPDIIWEMRITIEARENKGLNFVCTEEVWGYCTLTNEINAGGYLYLSWYSKGTLNQFVLLLTSKRSTQRREEHRQQDKVKV